MLAGQHQEWNMEERAQRSLYHIYSAKQWNNLGNQFASISTELTVVKGGNIFEYNLQMCLLFQKKVI